MLQSGYRASLAKRRDDVSAMFDRVAARYDVMNDLMTLGLTPAWRRAAVAAITPAPGMRILDLAAGTGTSTRPLTDAGALAVPADLSLGMLAVGKQREPDLPFLAGDALALPFADGVFDAVTISFGLRNVEDTTGALRELRRVTSPGGRLVISEFSRPSWAPFRELYALYLQAALPTLSRLASSNAEAYAYLIESIRAWPDQQSLAGVITAAGWTDVAWKNLAGGIVALHRATAA